MSIAVFDTVIIGTGQSGKPLALALARAGWKVAGARVAYLARRAKDYGVETGAVNVDMEQVHERKRRMVERFRGYVRKTLEKAPNLELIFGEARFKIGR